MKWTILLLFILSFPAQASLSLPFFQLKNFKLEVEQPIQEKKIVALLKKVENFNILFLNAQSLSEEISSVPWVDKIIIKKEFPHTLSVKISSRKPVALLKEKQDLIFIDRRGKKIESISAMTSSLWNLPLLNVPELYAKDWDLEKVLEKVEVLEKNFPVSEVFLGFYPEFSVFLKKHRIKVIFELASATEQVDKLRFLLRQPPKSLSEIYQVDLTNIKKAVVSSSVSK